MNSKLLHFLFVLGCAALIGLGPLRAQRPSGSSDANGSAVTAPARQSDASHSAVAPSSAASNDAGQAESQNDAKAAVDNDRGTVTTHAATLSRFNVGWLGLLGIVGLLGLLGLLRRGRRAEVVQAPEKQERVDYRRAA